MSSRSLLSIIKGRGLEAVPQGPSVVALFNASDYATGSTPTEANGVPLVSEKFAWSPTYDWVPDAVGSRIVNTNGYKELYTAHDNELYRRLVFNGGTITLDGDFTIDLFVTYAAYANMSFFHFGYENSSPPHTGMSSVDFYVSLPGYSGVDLFTYGSTLNDPNGVYFGYSRQGTRCRLSVNGLIVLDDDQFALSTISGPFTLGAGCTLGGFATYHAPSYIRSARVTKGLARNITSVPSLPLTPTI